MLGGATWHVWSWPCPCGSCDCNPAVTRKTLAGAGFFTPLAYSLTFFLSKAHEKKEVEGNRPRACAAFHLSPVTRELGFFSSSKAPVTPSSLQTGSALCMHMQWAVTGHERTGTELTRATALPWHGVPAAVTSHESSSFRVPFKSLFDAFLREGMVLQLVCS